MTGPPAFDGGGGMTWGWTGIFGTPSPYPRLRGGDVGIEGEGIRWMAGGGRGNDGRGAREWRAGGDGGATGGRWGGGYGSC